MNTVVIKKEYFDKIKSAVDAINEYFNSEFQKKGFSLIIEEDNLDSSIRKIIENLDGIDPTFISDPSKVEDALKEIEDNENSETSDELIESIASYYMLQKIADNFQEFSNLINGIYSFDLFLNPSKYKNAIDIFTDEIDLPYQMENLDVSYKIFDVHDYVVGLMTNEAIEFPSELTAEEETSRIVEGRDIPDTEVKVDASTTESYYEATDTNSERLDLESKNVAYDKSKKKFMPSVQLRSWYQELLDKLKKCDDIEELKTYFENYKFDPKDNKFLDFPIPYILSQVFSNDNKYTGDVPEIVTTLEDRVYKKKKEDKATSRFADYDLFSTFKADKKGTIKFLESYFSLDLVNDENATIDNNVLLALFNIFDSRIYLSTLGRLTEEGPATFVKEVRARINKSSRAVNVYQPNAKPDEEKEATPDDVQEYARNQIKYFGDISLNDILYCEQISHIVYDELSTISDRLYNENLSPIKINNYLGNNFGSAYFEQEKGAIPDYMKSRLDLSDDEGGKKKTERIPTPTDIPDPEEEPPANSIDDLADSVDSKVDRDGPIQDNMGTNFKPDKNADGKIVYNITNNFTNSFNSQVDSHATTTTTNDLSTGKTITNRSEGSHNVSTSVKTDDKKPSKNNYNNRATSVDTKGSERAVVSEQYYSNGMSFAEMLAYLESEEPLSSVGGTMKGEKSGTLSDAMARSRAKRDEKRKAKAEDKADKEKGSKLKPAYLVKNKLKQFVDSLIKRDEDQVKAEIIDNPSYRSSLYKAGRLAIKLGLTGLFFTISGWFGAIYLGIQGLKFADKQRLRTEVQDECLTEIRIIDEKIDYHRRNNDNPESRKKVYELMRMRSKLETIVADTSNGRERVRAVDRNRSRAGSSRSYW